jgi:hypothetical protein
VLVLIGAVYSGCKKTQSPFGVNAPQGLDIPSPTPDISRFYVSVVDLDKPATVANGFAAVTVYAVAPNGSVTLTALTGSNGTATITASTIPPGIWRIIVPGGQGLFPFSTSYLDIPVTISNQTVTMACGQTNLALTPTSLTTYYTSSGALFTYNLTYNQPNPLCIPVSLVISSFPTNWIASVSPISIGSNGSGQCSITIGGTTCLDAQPIFTVSGIDSTGNTRCVSAPATITHVFNTDLLVTWTTNSTPSVDAGSGDGCVLESYIAPPFMSCSGYCVDGWVTSVDIAYTNSCTKPTTINISNVNCGANCCGSGVWWNSSSYRSSANSGTAQTVLNSPVSAPLTITNCNGHGNPTLTFVLSNSDFSKGITYTGAVANSGTVTIFNESNWFF